MTSECFLALAHGFCYLIHHPILFTNNIDIVPSATSVEVSVYHLLHSGKLHIWRRIYTQEKLSRCPQSSSGMSCRRHTSDDTRHASSNPQYTNRRWHYCNGIVCLFLGRCKQMSIRLRQGTDNTPQKQFLPNLA